MKIIILGGNLTNLGAEAMVRTVVAEIGKRFKDADFFLFSTTDFNELGCKKTSKNLSILPWGISIGLRTFRFVDFILPEGLGDCRCKKEIRTLIKNADLVIDISGFALSSQFKSYRSLKYLFNIWIFTAFKRKLVLMPQSFGPFDYGVAFRFIFSLLGGRLLSRPVFVFAREEAGLQRLQRYSLNNLVLSPDIILQTSRSLQAKTVKKGKKIALLMPNVMLLEDHKKLESHYVDVVSCLPDDIEIKIMPHAADDVELVSNIHKTLNQKRKVSRIKMPESSECVGKIIAECDFVVGSRYHGIIHSLRECKPCIIWGWAEKYKE